MIYNLYTIMELLSLFIIIRGSVLVKNRGMKQAFFTAFFFFFSLGLMYLVHYRILPDTVMVFVYLGILIYVKKTQNAGWKSAVVNYILSVITLAIIEFFVTSIVFFVNDSEKYMEYNFLIICLIDLILAGILAKTILSKFFVEVKDFYINHKKVCAILLLLIAAEIIIFKFYGKLPAIQIFLISVFAIVLAIVVLIWQWDKKVMQTKIEQMKIESVYNDAFQSMIKEIRRKQHDFYNHINTICSLHATTKSYEELVERIESYGTKINDDKIDIIFDENSSPAIIGFLYTKLFEAKEKGIDVDTKISVRHAECNISEYKIIEILGILIDNAIEALENYDFDVPSIKIILVETNEGVVIQVDNKSPYIENRKIQNFFVQGFSTKGENRGLGLYNVKELVRKSGSMLIVENIDDGQDNWFSIKIQIGKENNATRIISKISAHY